MLSNFSSQAFILSYIDYCSKYCYYRILFLPAVINWRAESAALAGCSSRDKQPLHNLLSSLLWFSPAHGRGEGLQGLVEKRPWSGACTFEGIISEPQSSTHPSVQGRHPIFRCPTPTCTSERLQASYHFNVIWKVILQRLISIIYTCKPPHAAGEGVPVFSSTLWPLQGKYWWV